MDKNSNMDNWDNGFETVYAVNTKTKKYARDILKDLARRKQTVQVKQITRWIEKYFEFWLKN